MTGAGIPTLADRRSPVSVTYFSGSPRNRSRQRGLQK
jgi:hypothetical protein